MQCSMNLCNMVPLLPLSYLNGLQKKAFGSSASSRSKLLLPWAFIRCVTRSYWTMRFKLQLTAYASVASMCICTIRAQFLHFLRNFMLVVEISLITVVQCGIALGVRHWDQSLLISETFLGGDLWWRNTSRSSFAVDVSKPGFASICGRSLDWSREGDEVYFQFPNLKKHAEHFKPQRCVSKTIEVARACNQNFDCKDGITELPAFFACAKACHSLFLRSPIESIDFPKHACLFAKMS